MPQLDFIAFFNQLFYVYLFFILFYYFLIYFFLFLTKKSVILKEFLLQALYSIKKNKCFKFSKFFKSLLNIKNNKIYFLKNKTLTHTLSFLYNHKKVISRVTSLLVKN